MFVSYNTKKIRLAYKWKYDLSVKNSNFGNDYWWKKWHYIPAKSLSVLLRGITSNLKGHFYCLNCIHSYRTEKKLKKH